MQLKCYRKVKIKISYPPQTFAQTFEFNNNLTL